MLTTLLRTTIASVSAPREPRLVLAPTRASRAVLDGGWWPRSRDPAAELPGLILALSARYGRVRQVMLNTGAWDSRFHRLRVGTHTVRMGWFTTLDPAIAIVTTDRGDQIDLLVVPTRTPEPAARQAMTRAADPTDLTRAPRILADLTADVAAGPAPDVAAEPARPRPDDGNQKARRDSEGGRIGSGAVPVR